MFFSIKASAKDKQVLQKFSRFLHKLETFTFLVKCSPKQKKRKFITILNSPHVNKTAQEQFEFRFYHKQFLVTSFKPLTFLFLLKKIKNLSFSGLNIEIKSVLNRQNKNTSLKKLINPDNIFLDLQKKDDVSQTFSIKQYIQLFDCYGETFLKDLTCRNKF